MRKTRAKRLSVIENNSPPATHASIAALQFSDVKLFRNMTQAQRLKKSHDIADAVRPVAVLAAELLAIDKAELVAKVKTEYEVLGPMLMWLAHGAENARCMMNIIKSAEARLAIALANVEPDTDAEGAAN